MFRCDYEDITSKEMDRLYREYELGEKPCRIGGAQAARKRMVKEQTRYKGPGKQPSGTDKIPVWSGTLH